MLTPHPLFPSSSSKRLGCSKSTMFSIGGVTALKAHSFFRTTDWARLERCEVPPPIDILKDLQAAEGG
ncbi:hypothetical protein EON65_42760, partial [archaeon]